MNCDILELSFMGAGYTLFLQYIKYTIFILIIYLFVSGIFGIISNIESNFCFNTENS